MRGDRQKVALFANINGVVRPVQKRLHIQAAKQHIFLKQPLQFLIHAIFHFAAEYGAITFLAGEQMIKGVAKVRLTINAEHERWNAAAIGFLARHLRCFPCAGVWKGEKMANSDRCRHTSFQLTVALPSPPG